MSDERLAAEFKAGNEAAFNVLALRYPKELLEKWATKADSMRALSRADIEEAVDSVYCQLPALAYSFDPGEARWTTYIGTVLRRRVYDLTEWRGSRREVSAEQVKRGFLDLPSNGPGPVEAVGRRVDLNVLRGDLAIALLELPPQEGEALLWTIGRSRLTSAEVAERMGTTAGNVRSLTCRALAKLKTCPSIASWIDGFPWSN